MERKTKLTRAGISAHAAAVTYKQPLNLTTFKVGTGYNYEPDEEMVDIQGELIYSGRITALEMLSENTVKMTLSIPEGVPVNGVHQIGEAAIFLDNGEMFAIGTLAEPIPKTSQWSLEVDFVVVYTRLVSGININVNRECALPATTVDTMPTAEDASGNVWSVLDGTDQYEESSPALAVRYGMGGRGMQWSFVGFQRVFTGMASATRADGGLFSMYPPAYGWWCNDGEEVIVLTETEAKRAVYNELERTFTVIDQPFAVLNSRTVMRIWRCNTNDNALPSRVNVPAHFALHPGQNSWNARQDTRASSQLNMKHFTVLADGVQRIFPIEIDGTIVKGLVFVNGVLADPDNYNLKSELVFMTPPRAGLITGYAFYRTPTQGHQVVLAEDKWTVNGETDEFQLSVIPKNYDSIMVFVNEQLQPTSSYSMTGNVLKLNHKPFGRVTAVPVLHRERIGYTTRIIEQSWRTTGESRIYQVPVNVPNRAQTMLFLSGRYVVKEAYQFNGQNLELTDMPMAEQNLELLIFDNTEAEITSNERTGLNTGPVWRDPAGYMTEPCLLDVMQYDTTTYNGQNEVLIPADTNIVNSKYLWVFIDGLYQEPTTWEFKRENLGIRFNTIFSENHQITVLIFIPFEGEGYTTDFNIVSVPKGEKAADLVKLPYTPSSTLGRGVLVFAGGLLQHMAHFSTSESDQIKWVDVPADADYQILVITHTLARDATGEPRRFTKTQRGVKDFRMAEEVPKGNVFNFFSGLMQFEDSFMLNDRTVAFDEIPPSDAKYFQAYVYTGRPRTRLMTREEVEDSYVLRDGDSMRGPLNASVNGTTPDGFVSRDYVDQMLARLRMELVSSLR